MSYNTIPIDLDKEKLRYLLDKLSRRVLRRDEAVQLKPLLEKGWNDAVKHGDTKFALEIAQVVVALDGYIDRRVELARRRRAS
jgi:hypothetical protein